MLIAFDDDNTWPPSIIDLLLSSSQPLKDQDLLGQILEKSLPHDIIGFHATRLHRAHIEVLKNGTGSLAPLSPENEVARVYDVVYHGDLSQTEAEALLKTTRVHESAMNKPIRKGLLGLYFTDKVFGTTTCFKFFRYWGGESLGQYFFHESIVRRIGIPCIVKVSVPIRFITEISGKDFVNAYIQIHEEKYVDDGMYGYVDNPECPVTVLDVIEFGSERFAEMTSKADWTKPIHP